MAQSGSIDSGTEHYHFENAALSCAIEYSEHVRDDILFPNRVSFISNCRQFTPISILLLAVFLIKARLSRHSLVHSWESWHSTICRSSERLLIISDLSDYICTVSNYRFREFGGASNYSHYKSFLSRACLLHLRFPFYPSTYLVR